jgi:hypothetical protein
MISAALFRLYSFNANSLKLLFERKINTALKEINENEILFREENHSIWKRTRV